MAYKTIDERFWTDPGVKRMTPHSRLLFLYLISNPHAHYSGIYYLPRVVIPEETGLTAAQVTTALAALCTQKDRVSIGYRYPIDGVSEENPEQNETEKTPDRVSAVENDLKKPKRSAFVLTDPIYGVFWVCSMLRYQLGGTSKVSLKQIKGVANHLASLPPSALVPMFLQHYADLRIPFFLPEGYPIRGFSQNREEEEAEEESVEEKEPEAEGGARAARRRDKPSNGNGKKTPHKELMTMAEPDFIAWLKAQPAYQGINVEQVIEKLKVNFAVRGRVLTRKAIVNCLNREDRPLKPAETWEDALK